MTNMEKMPPPKSPGFEANLRTIQIDTILPVKQLPATVPKSQKYGQIAASIREVGLIDAEGELVAYGNFPDSYKPVLSEGSGKELIIRPILEVSDTAAITLVVDSSILWATQAWVLGQNYATQAWVAAQGYATQSWVLQQLKKLRPFRYYNSHP